MDFSSIFRVAPVQLPDPAEMMQRGLTLRALAQRNQLGEAELAEYKRKQATEEALNSALRASCRRDGRRSPFVRR